MNGINIGKKLKILREENGIKQKDVAKYLGITRAAYTNYETGYSIPRKERIARIARYFNVSESYFMDIEDKLGIMIDRLIHSTVNNKLEWEEFNFKSYQITVGKNNIRLIKEKDGIRLTVIDLLDGFVTVDILDKERIEIRKLYIEVENRFDKGLMEVLDSLNRLG